MCLKLNSKLVGIIGGGQLGMMLAEAIKKLGGRVIGLDPNPHCSITHACDEFICASYDDEEALRALCEKSDVVTYEFENIKGEHLKMLNEEYNIKQGIQSLIDSQDRLTEKNTARKFGLKTARFFKCDNEADLVDAINNLGYPALYKTRTEGYDGHGQVLIKSKEDLAKVRPYFNTNAKGIVEEFIKFDYEASVIMIGDNNKIVSLPVGHNIHKEGILDICEVPFDGVKDIEAAMKEASKGFMRKAGYKGILCIEYFIKDGEFYFNEMAPRPHNSGHYSIEALDYSQYDLFARYLLDMTYDEPQLLHKAIMKNILGRDLINVDYYLTQAPGFLHMYFKDEAREKRKMGHITFLDMDLKTFMEIEKGIE